MPTIELLLPIFQAGGKSAFSGFGGFAFNPKQTSTPLFSGGFSKTESKVPFQENKLSSIQETSEKNTNGNSSESGSANRTSYLSNLKSLNMSVLEWIKQHLEKNPYCILSPIFKDYDTHLNKLEQDKDKSDTSENNKDTKESNGSSLTKEESGCYFYTSLHSI